MSGLPKLPGYSVYTPPSGDKMHFKSQTLTYLKGQAQQEPAITFSYVKETMTPEELAAMATNNPSKPLTDGKLPQWIENSGKVLRFFGHFLESVVESAIENHRVRKVIILFYLEDGTIQMSEPKQDNSGIPQGAFVKRHKIFKDDGSVVSPEDFSVGESVTIYGRTIFLNDCDDYTRGWYAKHLSKEQGPNMPYPLDLNAAFRENLQDRSLRAARVAEANGTFHHGDYMEARLGKQFDGDKVHQYLRSDREVLRFYCLWDNRADLYGDRRPYVLHYYLADDTVDILEINERNSGRDPFPVFLKRAPLPKGLDRGTVVTGKASRTSFYRPADLRIGAHIPVLSRQFLIHDCDEFTRGWYQRAMGFSAEDMAALNIADPIIPKVKPALPPYNGYGTLEDSLQNCTSLMPKPPRKDMHKLMNKDKIVLRFQAKMVDSDLYKLSHADVGRRFIVSYFLMDDTVQIFEPPVRNSGIVAGKFLERGRVYKPASEDIFTFQDLYVGCRLEVHRREFELLEADEYTYQYMENNKHLFIMADADAIARILRAQINKGNEEDIRTAFIEMDTDGSGYLSGDELEAALGKAGLKFQRHQIISLRRKLDEDKSGAVSIEEFLSYLGIGTEA